MSAFRTQLQLAEEAEHELVIRRFPRILNMVEEQLQMVHEKIMSGELDPETRASFREIYDMQKDLMDTASNMLGYNEPDAETFSLQLKGKQSRKPRWDHLLPEEPEEAEYEEVKTNGKKKKKR